MRKLLLSLGCMLFMAGLVAADVLVLNKYDKDAKEATFKDGDKEVKAKLTDKTKVTITDKDGNTKDATLEDVTKRWSNEKSIGKKYDVTIKDGNITDVKLKAGKK